ncbi:MAG: hypothetical protein SVV03_01160 [Candidatus Nanohaloarchaea archaeon]|nr:hypothetical protein [Candidatus Nanohaloarchaea archaeon]
MPELLETQKEEIRISDGELRKMAERDFEIFKKNLDRLSGEQD